MGGTEEIRPQGTLGGHMETLDVFCETQPRFEGPAEETDLWKYESDFVLFFYAVRKHKDPSLLL